MKIEGAVKWMEEAIQDAKEFFDQCSPALQKELTEQEEVFKLAIVALCSVSRVQELEAENKELKERIVNWRKYMAPAHIDRSEWTAEWVPMTDDDGCVWLECSTCEYNLDSLEESHPFCPSCGRAMTEEAWAELERRLMK